MRYCFIAQEIISTHTDTLNSENMWRKLVRQIQAWYKNEAFYLYLAQGARCLCQLPNYVILFADVNEPKKKEEKNG